nr:hypothetical protein [Bythopirellula goksoeyrii]
MACFRTPAATFCALFAVIMIVDLTLLGTPVTHLGTKSADLLRVFAIHGHSICAQSADSCTFQATFWTVVIGILVEHFDQAFQTSSSALGTGLDAVF